VIAYPASRVAFHSPDRSTRRRWPVRR
jgi:hypothetical protein